VRREKILPTQLQSSQRQRERYRRFILFRENFIVGGGRGGGEERENKIFKTELRHTATAADTATHQQRSSDGLEGGRVVIIISRRHGTIWPSSSIIAIFTRTAVTCGTSIPSQWQLLMERCLIDFYLRLLLPTDGIRYKTYCEMNIPPPSFLLSSPGFSSSQLEHFQGISVP
jgi:hypothetical protein